jgi:microcompartment protein CcmL/EutN
MLVSSALFADTPAQISADYRAKATQALEGVNQTLERAVASITANLVKSGDTSAAKTVTEQMKQKVTGEVVANPHPSLQALFAQYEGARAKVLAPVQQSCIARISGLLSTSEGKKVEVVAKLGEIRAEIEAAKLTPGEAKVPVRWTYHSTLENTRPMAEIQFRPDGIFEMTASQTGRWKANSKGDQITITLKDKTQWKVMIEGDVATVERPDMGKRYLRVAKP